MKHIFIIVLLVSAFSGQIAAVDKKTNQRQKQTPELKEIEAARSEAIKKGDLKKLDEIYADDFRGVAANGRVVSKTELMRIFKNNDPSIVFTTEELEVKTLDEKNAVVTGLLTGKTASGETISSSRFMHVYSKRNKRWQFVAGQATLVSRQ